MYIENMHDLFKEIPVQISKPLSLEEEFQSLLYAIGCYWYMKKLIRIFHP